MREITLDTETTGFDPLQGHRVVEIGCLELINHVPTGRRFHAYLNPDRDMPEDAFRVHGLSADFLADKPRFAEIKSAFLDFIAADPLVIHNAEFDLRFLNAELTRCKSPTIPVGRAIDTVRLARSKYPGAPASLDALCKRFGIDLSARAQHGALLDATLLAEVYLELIGGRQPGFLVGEGEVGEAATGSQRQPARPRPRPLAPRLTAAEKAAHEAFIAKELKGEVLWRVFRSE